MFLAETHSLQFSPWRYGLIYVHPSSCLTKFQKALKKREWLHIFRVILCSILNHFLNQWQIDTSIIKTKKKWVIQPILSISNTKRATTKNWVIMRLDIIQISLVVSLSRESASASTHQQCSLVVSKSVSKLNTTKTIPSKDGAIKIKKYYIVLQSCFWLRVHQNKRKDMTHRKCNNLRTG